MKTNRETQELPLHPALLRRTSEKGTLFHAIENLDGATFFKEITLSEKNEKGNGKLSESRKQKAESGKGPPGPGLICASEPNLS